jgi:RNA methyltransferase, TrmH family
MITSRQNPRLQMLRGLLNQHKNRLAADQFIVEGVRLLEEAWLQKYRPAAIYYTSQCSARGQQIINAYRQQGVEMEELSPDLMDSLALTDTSQGVLAVFPAFKPVLPPQADFILIIDQVRDPGNLGTMLRTAAAAGVNAAILTPGTSEAFAPKVLRSGMGAHFRLPILSMDWDEIKRYASQRQPALRLFLSAASDSANCWALNLRQPLGLIIGGEADGASPAAHAASDELISIPMPGQSESLNAAVAAGILLFEVVRQRS